MTNSLPKYCRALTLIMLLGWFCHCAGDQPNALNRMPDWDEPFQSGVNTGYYPPFYDDLDLARLARDAGALTIRQGLFQHVLEKWGYSARLSEFGKYQSLGLHHIIVISGFPTETDRDTVHYCPNDRSRMFRQMYEPIWDHGENGTPVNESNPYACYIWKAVTAYRGLVHIWEVWNEPDRGENGWLAPGTPGNWWDNPPAPCDLSIKAPVFQYVRALRITYEVVKSVDPQALVATGGLGWPAFLDAVCRYTDRPGNGLVTPDSFPFTGGAYFDCFSFHSYPHLTACFQQREEAWNSDGAIDCLWQQKTAFDSVLIRHGFDGLRYPAKIAVCSEFNLPRIQTGHFAATERTQINFLIKALAGASAHGMAQMHVYSLCDENPEFVNDPEFGQMGLFQNPAGQKPGHAIPHDAAVAYKSCSVLLENCRYDPVATVGLRLSPKIGGAVFRDPDGKQICVLWAKTGQANSENGSCRFELPEYMRRKKWKLKQWDFSTTGQEIPLARQELELSGTPVFLEEN